MLLPPEPLYEPVRDRGYGACLKLPQMWSTRHPHGPRLGLPIGDSCPGASLACRRSCTCSLCLCGHESRRGTLLHIRLTRMLPRGMLSFPGSKGSCAQVVPLQSVDSRAWARRTAQRYLSRSRAVEGDPLRAAIASNPLDARSWALVSPAMICGRDKSPAPDLSCEPDGGRWHISRALVYDASSAQPCSSCCTVQGSQCGCSFASPLPGKHWQLPKHTCLWPP